jgi:hypothetical protein
LTSQARQSCCNSKSDNIRGTSPVLDCSPDGYQYDFVHSIIQAEIQS